MLDELKLLANERDVPYQSLITNGKICDFLVIRGSFLSTTLDVRTAWNAGVRHNTIGVLAQL